MSAIIAIACSEFIRRVTTKGFIIATLLAPLGIVAFFAVTIAVSVNVIGQDERRIAVVDETGVVLERLLEASNPGYTLVHADSTTVRSEVLAGRYDGFVTIPAEVLEGEGTVHYFAEAGGGFGVADFLQHRIRLAVRDHRIAAADITQETLDIINTQVSVQSVKLTDAGDQADSTLMDGAFGGMVGMLIYVALLIYGSVVMQGVMEEKQTRIVEVIVSSTRPFNLLMGKVLGIGAMGLVQLACWALIMFLITSFAGTVALMFIEPESLGLDAAATSGELLAASGIALPTIELTVLAGFVLFFLGGYFLYAGLFAAVGSMVERPQEAQYYLLPVMMPIILSIVFITVILQSPNSTLAVLLSMFPFTSSVPMVVRLAVTNVPFWEVCLSLLLLIGGFIGTIWVSSRIYRVGILMYGKKASPMDVIRWLRYG